MKYAKDINDIINAFKPGPLEPDELDEFFCDGTIEERTGDIYISPIKDIFEACQKPGERNTFLFLGHKGCGKSTELNKMADQLRKKGYEALIINCNADIDLVNPIYTDILILMGEALLKIAEKAGCKLDRAIEEQLLSFWARETVETGIVGKTAELSIEAGAKMGTPAFFSSIIQLFTSAKSDLKYSSEKRTEYKEKINPRDEEWVSMLNTIADIVTEKLDGKQPILIFDDLDKLDNTVNNIEAVWEIFSFKASLLTGPKFPVVYTFPISLFYDPRIASLEAYYKLKILPMIELMTSDGKPNTSGNAVIRKILEMRADSKLFEDGVAEKMINKTGGSLRDLFQCINDAAIRAIRRESAVVAMEDADIALKGIKSTLTRRIERKNYDFLADIFNGNHKAIEDKAMLLDMLKGNIVLEYNQERWHNVHPLIADFLADLKLVKREP